jgi:protein-tyrosine-phosphatase
MAEAILRHRAEERLRAASAGESTADRVNPLALECLRAHGIATEGLKSKAWGQLFGLNKPSVRLVIALSDVYAATANWPRDRSRQFLALPLEQFEGRALAQELERIARVGQVLDAVN